MLEAAEAPRRLGSLAGVDEGDVEPVIGGQPAGVLDHHADSARELEVLREEGDPHEAAYRSRPVRGPLDRAAYPYPLPPVGEPLRVAFVGPRLSFDACALHAPAGGLAPAFVDFRADSDPLELRAALRAAAPHVVVAFGPQTVPEGLLSDLPAAALGFLTRPIPRWEGAPPPPAPAEGELGRTDAAGFDRLVALDPLVAEAPSVWRSVPLPVDDRMYAPVGPPRHPPRALFLGSSSAYRERFLIQAKHEHDLLHYAHGLWGDALREVLARTDVGINVHTDRQPSFENRVLLHLAAGHLLLSEPLSPLHGLEAEIDFIPIMRPDELLTVLGALARRPDLHDRVRLRGRAKAEDYRASRVWPRLLGDLLDDLAAFGTARVVTAPRRSAARGG
jgi:hypothetical protein